MSFILGVVGFVLMVIGMIISSPELLIGGLGLITAAVVWLNLKDRRLI